MIREINSGVYAFDAAFLTAGLAELSGHNAQGELYLTDLVAAAVARGLPVSSVGCPDLWQVQGVNDRVQLANLRAELNRRVLERWMLAGVTVVDPTTTWVDVGVRLGRDVVLRHPLYGSTVVDDGAQVGPDGALTDVNDRAGSTVVPAGAPSESVANASQWAVAAARCPARSPADQAFVRRHRYRGGRCTDLRRGRRSARSRHRRVVIFVNYDLRAQAAPPLDVRHGLGHHVHRPGRGRRRRLRCRRCCAGRPRGAGGSAGHSIIELGRRTAGFAAEAAGRYRSGL